MELRQLRYFVTLASSLNYSRAADQLCITQGTLSQQISQLESELDTRLFDRTSRRVSLTDAGRMLLPLAQRTLDESAMCKRRMLEMKRLQCGTLRIGAAYCFDRFLPDALKLMRSRHPEVTLQVCRRKSSEILGLVRACEIDLALAFVPQAFAAPGVMHVETLFVSRPCAILRRDHPLAGGPGGSDPRGSNEPRGSDPQGSLSDPEQLVRVVAAGVSLLHDGIGHRLGHLGRAREYPQAVIAA